MNQNKIFYVYQDTNKLDKIIKHGQTTKTYLATKLQQFIKLHNKHLDIKEYEQYTFPFLPNYIFLIALTKTNTNHPYGLYINLDSNMLNFIIPLGKERKQADIEDYEYAITKSGPAELAMIYLIIERSILIRKKAILTPGQFTLLDCDNITGCIKKRQEINKMNINFVQKQAMMNKYYEYYLNKAVDVLKKYFHYLDKEEWDEALDYLKGGNVDNDKDKNKKNKDKKLFGKERVNNFFKNNKKIIGHLEIFIPIYKLFFHSRNTLLKKLKY